MNEEADHVGGEPILIDKSLLPAQNGDLLPKPTGQPYTINGDTFYVEDRPEREYKQFQVYAERLSNITGNFFVANDGADNQYMYCSTPESDYVEDALYNDAELKMTITQLPHGIVINSNVYLTLDQWNTIQKVDNHLLRCVVCEMFTDIDSLSFHVESESHLERLDRWRPLARFDLSITRMIRNQYHCAICNETFELDNETFHFESKSHEGNLLSAVSKVSDIDLTNNEAGNTNNDCYHFNANAINNIHYRNKNNDYTNKFNDFDNSSVDSIEDYENNDNDYDDEADSVWGTPQKTEKSGFSYASMLKKPKILDIPMFLEKDIGNRKVKVRFDSYHMLIKPKLNRFYCMVCKDYSHIRCKAEHCDDAGHLHKLAQCKVVLTFGDYFVREMDDKFYHCGHCNNLVLLNDMEDHLEKKHAKKRTTSECAKKCADSPKNKCNGKDDAKSRVNGDSEPVKNGISDNAKCNDDGNRINDRKTSNSISKNNDGSHKDTIVNNDLMIASAVKENNHNDVMKVNKPVMLNDVIVITPFRHKITIPLLSFNVVLKRQHYSDFYCGLCDRICAEEHVLPHIYCLTHIQMLQRTPFILPFNCNLIRAIREKFHCAICNLPISVQLIYAHIQDPLHIHLLNKALGINAGVPPSVKSNTAPNILQNNVQNRPTPPIVSINDNSNKSNAKIDATEMKLTKVLEAEKEEKKTDATKETVATENKADEMDLMLDDSIESVELNFEDYVYVKMKSSYFKISFSAYNTLVYIGNGIRYCFVCTVKVNREELKKHVENRKHMENIIKSKFLDLYEDTLLRQVFLMYHCGVCNVLVSRKELKNHLVWPTHTKETASAQSVPKKTRKNEVKSGKIMYVATVTKDIIYLNEKEPQIKVLFKVRGGQVAPLVRKSKIVIVNSDVLKIKFENWHGVLECAGGGRCLLCQVGWEGGVGDHVMGVRHEDSLRRGVLDNYLVHLLRQINDAVLHCMICNAEVYNKEHIILEHVEGKRHKAALDHIRNDSIKSDAYTDCENDVLHL